MDFDSLHSEYAVYWPYLGVGPNQKATYGPAEEIKCRWEKSHMEMKDATKTNGVWTSKAQVFSTVEFVEGGYLWRGRYSKLIDALVPTKNRDAARIEAVDDTPSIDAAEREFIAYL